MPRKKKVRKKGDPDKFASLYFPDPIVRAKIEALADLYQTSFNNIVVQALTQIADAKLTVKKRELKIWL